MASLPQHLSAAANTGPTLRPAANRVRGAHSHDFTSHMPSQITWTIDNMPDINFQWKPTAANIRVGEVGRKPYLIFGKHLRDFDVLPDRISSNLEPWLVQAWFRLDSRMIWKDITDRIEPTARPKWNTINMDCVRLREDFFMRPWSSSKGASTHARDDVFEDVLRRAGINPFNNTTRGLTPGLIDPTAGANSARVAVPNRWAITRKQRKADTKRWAASVAGQQATGRSGANLENDYQVSVSSQPRASTNEKERASRIERPETSEPKERMLGKRKIVTTKSGEHEEEERQRKKPRVHFKAVKPFRGVRAAEDLFASAGLNSRVDKKIQTRAIKGLNFEEVESPSLLVSNGGARYSGLSGLSSGPPEHQRSGSGSNGDASFVQSSDEPNPSINTALSYLHSSLHQIHYPNAELALSDILKPYTQCHNTWEQDAPVMQAPVAQMSGYQSHAHAGNGRSTDLSLPSSVMEPEDLGDDTAPAADPELFNGYTTEGIGYFL